jgi:hypothetical protein
MIIQKFTEPWEHYEIENFLTKKELEFTQLYISEHMDFYKKKINVYSRYLYNLNHNDLLYNILKKRFYSLDEIKKVSNEKNFINIDLSICSAGFNKSLIHSDTDAKIYSGILYINENENGTLLYTDITEDSLNKTVHWKNNKLFLFKRTEYSWHNFNNLNSETNRVTLNLNVFKSCFQVPKGKNDGTYLKEEYANRK